MSDVRPCVRCERAGVREQMRRSECHCVRAWAGEWTVRDNTGRRAGGRIHGADVERVDD